MGTTLPLLGLVLARRYKITDHIGEGAMASVFAGQDLEAGGAPIAIKVMLPHLAQDRTFSARFKREAQAASMVKHPSSVAIHSIGEENGIHFIVMELCAGRDLRETLKVQRRLPELRAVRILRAVADALRVAHDLGVIHRDLKPENVMISHDPEAQTDRVKVLDFGIAKLVAPLPKLRGDATDSDPAPAITQFGVVVGTPQYMSPEQVRGHALDGRSDIYTCGILLYQMVTGTLPFDGESPLEVAGRHAFEVPKSPRSVLPTLDPRLDAIIMRLLSKQPEDRPQTAAELSDLLELWERGAVETSVAPVGAGFTTPLEPLGAGRAVGGPFVARGGPPAGAPARRGQLGTLMDLENEAEAGIAAAGSMHQQHPVPFVEPAQPLPTGFTPAHGAPILGPAPASPGPQAHASPGPQPPAAAQAAPRKASRVVGLVALFASAFLGVGLGVGLHMVCTGELLAPPQPAPGEEAPPSAPLPICG